MQSRGTRPAQAPAQTGGEELVADEVVRPSAEAKLVRFVAAPEVEPLQSVLDRVPNHQPVEDEPDAGRGIRMIPALHVFHQHAVAGEIEPGGQHTVPPLYDAHPEPARLREERRRLFQESREALAEEERVA